MKTDLQVEHEKLKQQYVELLNDLKNGTELLDRLQEENAQLKRELSRRLEND